MVDARIDSLGERRHLWMIYQLSLRLIILLVLRFIYDRDRPDDRIN